LHIRPAHLAELLSLDYLAAALWTKHRAFSSPARFYGDSLLPSASTYKPAQPYTESVAREFELS
jgi:hypothetical protein